MSRDSDDQVPGIDSAGNEYTQDVIGNKSDTVGGDSIVALLKAAAAGSGADVTAIKAVTDVIPDAGAMTSIAQEATLGTPVADVSTDIAGVQTDTTAIKAVTDVLPDAGALTSIAQEATLVTIDSIVDAIKAITDNAKNVARKTLTFSNTTGAPSLFTVTGAVRAKIFAFVKTTCASAGACNGEVGIAGATTIFIAQTDMTLCAAGEIWHDATPDAGHELSSIGAEYILGDGQDVILTLSAQVDSGEIEFVCEFTPLSADGAVVAS